MKKIIIAWLIITILTITISISYFCGFCSGRDRGYESDRDRWYKSGYESAYLLGRISGIHDTIQEINNAVSPREIRNATAYYINNATNSDYIRINFDNLIDLEK